MYNVWIADCVRGADYGLYENKIADCMRGGLPVTEVAYFRTLDWSCNLFLIGHLKKLDNFRQFFQAIVEESHQIATYTQLVS